jgi:hypothetical protein
MELVLDHDSAFEVLLVDFREPSENEYCRLEGSLLRNPAVLNMTTD